VPSVPQPPRRRISDRNYSSLERQLDLVNERVDDGADRLAAIDRRISEVRADLAQTRRENNDRLDRLETQLRDNFERNFREHKTVQRDLREVAQTVESTRLDAAVKYATIISFLLVPILAAWVASGQ
jgi:chromosome segregation ATPase